MAIPFYLKMCDTDQNAHISMVVKILDMIRPYPIQWTSWYTWSPLISVHTRQPLYFSLKLEIA